MKQQRKTILLLFAILSLSAVQAQMKQGVLYEDPVGSSSPAIYHGTVRILNDTQFVSCHTGWYQSVFTLVDYAGTTRFISIDNLWIRDFQIVNDKIVFCGFDVPTDMPWYGNGAVIGAFDLSAFTPSSTTTILYYKLNPSFRDLNRLEVYYDNTIGKHRVVALGDIAFFYPEGCQRVFECEYDQATGAFYNGKTNLGSRQYRFDDIIVTDRYVIITGEDPDGNGTWLRRCQKHSVTSSLDFATVYCYPNDCETFYMAQRGMYMYDNFFAVSCPNAINCDHENCNLTMRLFDEITMDMVHSQRVTYPQKVTTRDLVYLKELNLLVASGHCCNDTYNYQLHDFMLPLKPFVPADYTTNQYYLADYHGNHPFSCMEALKGKAVVATTEWGMVWQYKDFSLGDCFAPDPCMKYLVQPVHVLDPIPHTVITDEKGQASVGLTPFTKFSLPWSVSTLNCVCY